MEMRKDSILIHEAHSLNMQAGPFKLLATMNAFPKRYGIFPLESKIAEKAGMSEPSVQRAKKWLCSNNYISWDKIGKTGRPGLSCDYEIKPVCYAEPAGWDSTDHYFMKAGRSGEFSPDQWRFLCLINTSGGWGVSKTSINSLVKKWKMDHRTFNKTWKQLIEKEAIDRWLQIDDDLFYRTPAKG